MVELRKLEEDIVARGRVDGPELQALRERIYLDGTVKRSQADFLVELYKRVPRRTPAFEQFFYQAIKHHILSHGRISAESVAWLRRVLFADRKISDEERKFLHELKGEAQQVDPAFEGLFRESMKQAPEQRTSGG
jgi:hypothetical protein